MSIGAVLNTSFWKAWNASVVQDRDLGFTLWSVVRGDVRVL